MSNESPVTVSVPNCAIFNCILKLVSLSGCETKPPSVRLCRFSSRIGFMMAGNKSPIKPSIIGKNIFAMPSRGIHIVPKKPKSIQTSASSSFTPSNTKLEFSRLTFISPLTDVTLASVSTIMR